MEKQPTRYFRGRPTLVMTEILLQLKLEPKFYPNIFCQSFCTSKALQLFPIFALREMNMTRQRFSGD